ncbi:hypothetical protein BDV18DRAFT_160410 [Aspergillus unguis]
MSSTQPPQPPKQSAYTQSSNAVSHNPAETSEQRSHTYGTPPDAITRGASSIPSTQNTLAATEQKHAASQNAMAREADVDTQYGVEQQPSEGDIAQAVEGHSRHRVQAGAHAGAVGSAQGPGMPGRNEGESNLKDLGRKEEEHWKILGERVGRSPGVENDHEIEGEGELAERERVRQRKLRQDRELHPKDAVQEATGDPVVGR